jgi:integrase/recombinase XerD
LDFELWKQRFADWLETRFESKDTRHNYSAGLLPFLDFVNRHGATSWTEVNRDWIEEYRSHIFTARNVRTGKPLATGTRVARLISVKVFFKFLVREGYLMANPAALLELPKVHKALPVVLSEAEMLQILEVPNVRTRAGIRDRALLELLYGTAARNQELISIKLGELDLNQRLLRLPKGKGNKPRVVPLGQEAHYWAERYLAEVRPAWCRNPKLEAVFLDRWGQNGLSRGGLTRLIGEIAEQLDFGKRVTPHILRHSCATHMLKRGAGLRQIQELLGHSQLTSTEHYTRVDVTDLRKVINRCHPRERA